MAEVRRTCGGDGVEGVLVSGWAESGREDTVAAMRMTERDCRDKYDLNL